MLLTDSHKNQSPEEDQVTRFHRKMDDTCLVWLSLVHSDLRRDSLLNEAYSAGIREVVLATDKLKAI